MINVAEHCKRPKDMLMFLGEYFKNVIKETNEIEDKRKTIQKGMFFQEKFLITNEIMNSLGTACKMYLENLKHELRLSIALIRNPDFHSDKDKDGGPLVEELSKNIQHIQMEIIDRCEKLYKFIDCLQDFRKPVPTKSKEQPQKNHLDGMFYKLKAD